MRWACEWEIYCCLEQKSSARSGPLLVSLLYSIMLRSAQQAAVTDCTVVDVVEPSTLYKAPTPAPLLHPFFDPR